MNAPLHAVEGLASLTSKCGSATLLDPHGGRPASAGLGALMTAVPLDPAAASAPQPTHFGQWFVDELAAVNTQMVNAERSVQMLAAGGGASLHDTMLQLEQARMQFQLAIQVRSRVLEAYQEIMRMQV